MNSLDLFLIGLAINLTLMTIIWFISSIKKNAGIVDVAWGSGIGLIACLYAFFGQGSDLYRILAFGLTSLWALRLSSFLYLTRVKGKNHEDPRYTELRNGWKHFKNLKMYGFFLFQGIVGCVFSLPALILSQSNKIHLGFLELLGIFIWAIAILGETFADSQLAQFKAHLNHKGKVCNVGLWKYSRHPNYFFEWLVWVGLALTALSSNMGFIGLICPAMILFFLLKVSGIPATESQALRSKGEAYRRYQETTSIFVPWFPKKGVV